MSADPGAILIFYTMDIPVCVYQLKIFKITMTIWDNISMTSQCLTTNRVDIANLTNYTPECCPGYATVVHSCIFLNHKGKQL